MGLKQVKGEVAADAARRAIEEGHKVFVFRVNPGAWDAGSTGAVRGFAEQIEGIEAEGWTLDHMAFAGDERKATGFFLFRLRGAQ